MWESIIDEIERLELSFDEFLALYKVYSCETNSRKIQYDSDVLSTYIELESKGLIKIMANENEALTFFLREKGSDLVKSFCTAQPTITEIKTAFPTEQPKLISNIHKFEEFWMAFPTSDEHGVYRKTRILKAGKENCKKKYLALLNEGVSHADILKALKYEIKLRRDGNNRQNNMMYMKNSLTWLNQKEFEIILETMTEDNESTSQDDWTSNSI
jgi:hypothetical protein